jgi:hypothetical protein
VLCYILTLNPWKIQEFKIIKFPLVGFIEETIPNFHSFIPPHTDLGSVVGQVETINTFNQFFDKGIDTDIIPWTIFVINKKIVNGFTITRAVFTANV